MKHSHRPSLMTAALMTALLSAPARPAQNSRIITQDQSLAPQHEPEQPEPIGTEPLSLLKRLPANTQGRDFVVGGLHGCFTLLMGMLRKLDFDTAKDRLFCTGNLGNHGPEAPDCYALLDEPWFHAVAGSFEALLVRAAITPGFDQQKLVAAGGMWATNAQPERALELAEKLAELPLAIAVESEGYARFNVLHAEFNGPDIALDDALEDITTGHPVPGCLTSGTNVIKGVADVAEQDGLSLTFVGHTLVKQVGKVGQHVFIDTAPHIALRTGNHVEHGMTIIEVLTGRMWRSQAA